MNTFEDQLIRDFAVAAQTVKLRPGRPVEVIRRAKCRQYRRRRVGLAASLLLATATTVGILQLAGRLSTTHVRVSEQPSADAPTDGSAPPESTSVAETEPNPTEVTSGIATLVSSPLTWEHAESSRWLNGPLVRDATDGMLYSVSTHPGVHKQPFQHVIIQSPDGVNWNEINTYPSRIAFSLDADAGRLYSVGTAPSASGAIGAGDYGDLVTHVLVDGRWITAPLPDVDMPAIRQRFGGGFSQTYDVVAGPLGTLVAEAVGAVFDVHRLPSEYKDSFPADLLGADAPTVQSGGLVAGDRNGGGRLYTWSELGVAEADIRLLEATPRFYLSVGDGTFEEVSVPLPPASFYDWVALYADDAGFAIFATPRLDSGPVQPILYGDTVVLTSTNGRDWQTAPAFGASEVLDIGRVHGELVAVASDTDGLSIARLTNGAWLRRGIPDLVGQVRGQQGQINANLALIGGESVVLDLRWRRDPIKEAGGARIEHPGHSLVVETWDMGTLKVLDKSGTEIGTVKNRQFVSGPVRIDQDLSVEVLDRASAVVDTFTDAEIRTAVGVGRLEAPATMPPESEYLATTDDLGATWSLTPAEQLGGEPIAGFIRLVASSDGFQLFCEGQAQADGGIPRTIVITAHRPAS